MGHAVRGRVGWQAGLTVMALAAGCLVSCHMSRIIVPSLGPVDPIRPMVKYRPIQGHACEHFILHFIPTGTNTLVEAMWEMQRLENADGYVEVTAEDHTAWWLLGHSICTTVTAYPFTYGTEPKELRVRGAQPTSPEYGHSQPSGPKPRSEEPRTAEPRPEPKPEPKPEPRKEPASSAPSAAACGTACTAYGKHAGATELIQRVVTEKCQNRCMSGDLPYYQCVTRARTSEDVKTCNSLPAQEP